ncbi:MAG: hypothetical protein ACW99F_16475 [Candidatus Hodarchaeales archaeon]|jgi:hypothetical protein
MLTTYDDIIIEASDSAHNPVGTYFIENPIIDDVDNSYPNDKPLGIFLLEKPKDDTYHLTITNNSKDEYKLKAYVYDENGDVEMFNFKSSINDDFQDIALIISGNETSILHDKFANAYKLTTENKDEFNKSWIYKYLTRKLRNISKHHLKGHYKVAEKAVNQIIRMVNRSTPRFINPDLSNELINSLNLIFP